MSRVFRFLPVGFAFYFFFLNVFCRSAADTPAAFCHSERSEESGVADTPAAGEIFFLNYYSGRKRPPLLIKKTKPCTTNMRAPQKAKSEAGEASTSVRCKEHR